MADHGPKSETSAEPPRSEPSDLDCDGIGDAGRSINGSGPESNRNETVGDSLSESSEDSDGEQSDGDTRGPQVSQGATRIDRSQASGSAVIAPQNQVTVLNFGEVKLEGKTEGIEIGNKTEYHGSVTVQQIVHRDADGWSPEADPSSVLRSRGLPSSGEASQVWVRRTGMVLRDDNTSARSGGCGEGSAKRAGNSFLLKHLLGRKAETAAWIPIAFLSCFALIAIAIDSFIFGLFHHRRGTLTPASQSLVYKPTECPEYPPIQSKGKPEALPNLHRTVIIPRIMWLAQPALEHTSLKHPVEYVIISHTATEPCYDQAGCSMQVRMVQKFHVESRQWSDIGYNFLVGGDGNAYEGRGWEYVGAHAKGYNIVSIGISFIGTFSDVLPPPAQIRACKLLIKEGVSLGKIATNYKLIGHRQVSPTESPGEKLYEELQNWEHWSPEV